MKNTAIKIAQSRRALATGMALALAGSVLHAASLQVTVVDRNGAPAYDAVVVVVPTAGGVAKNPPPLTATVNQVRLSEPVMTAGVAAGRAAEAFSLRLAGKTDGKSASGAEVILDKPGEYGAALLSCLIHGSMSGHVYVAESPWTVKTDADGIATFNDLPDGTATVKVWHAAQLLVKPLLPVTLSATPVRASVQLDVQMRRRRM
jgi:hypothetical protein